jgi:hypothetical protein
MHDKKKGSVSRLNSANHGARVAARRDGRAAEEEERA